MSATSTPTPTSKPLRTEDRAMVLSVATANTPHWYSQEEVLDAYDITDPVVRSIFLNGGIDGRYLCIPDALPDGSRPHEAQGELLEKHATAGVSMAVEAIEKALAESVHDNADVEYLCCITSTGYITPGFSALLIKQLGMAPDTSRVDIVGMGCNAGLNGLNPVAAWARANPGKLAVMACVEVCSAAYVFDGSMRTAVVNSLFGDGAAAITVMAGPDELRLNRATPVPRIVDFRSRIVVDAIGAMRYDWDDEATKFSFYLDPDIPYVVGANAETVVDSLLADYGLQRENIDHWVVHSGGKKVIDSVSVNLGLTAHDVRHTLSVLSDFGNLSSSSFLFSYARLIDEGVVSHRDLGFLMTMGPGSTIETALVRW